MKIHLTIAKCTHIYLNAQCGTGQRSKTHSFCQVHSHLLECIMWHRTEIQNPFILPSALTFT